MNKMRKKYLFKEGKSYSHVKSLKKNKPQTHKPICWDELDSPTILIE